MFVECHVNSHLLTASVICLYINPLCSRLSIYQYAYYTFLIFRYRIMRRCAQTNETICIMRNVIQGSILFDKFSEIIKALCSIERNTIKSSYGNMA